MKYIKWALFILAIIASLALGFYMKTDNTIVIKSETIQTFENVPQWMLDQKAGVKQGNIHHGDI